MPLLNPARLPNLKPENIKAWVNIAGIMWTAWLTMTWVATQNYSAWGINIPYRKVGNFYFFGSTVVGYSGPGGSHPINLGAWVETGTWTGSLAAVTDKIASDFWKTKVNYWVLYCTSEASNVYALFGMLSWNWTSWVQLYWWQSNYYFIPWIEMV